MSLEDLIYKVFDFAIETGRTILVGDRDKPSVNLLDYIKMGFFGILFTICIIISFTGIGTIPGIAFGYLIITSLTKKGHFLGIIPFIISMLIADIIVVIILLNMIANI